MRIKDKLIVSLLLIALLPIFGMITFMSFNILDTLLSNALIEEERDIVTGEFIVNKFLSRSEGDVLFLSNLSSLDRLINAGTYEELIDSKKQVEKDFLGLAEQNEIYYQIRYINKNGDEVVRVDNTGEGAQLISSNNLQNKASRYYFTDALKKNEGEVFISPLDLNVENGEIEVRSVIDHQTYVPVIRYATPVFDDAGNNEGVVITNIYARGFLEELTSLNHSKSSKDIFLINDNGYFLLNPEKDKEWGFMFNNDETISKNCEKAEMIMEQKEGQVFSSVTNSYFTFRKIDLHDPLTLNADKELNQDEFWVVVSKTQKSAILQVVNRLRVKALILALLSGVLVLMLALLLSRIITKPLSKLKGGIDIIKKGNLDFKVNVKTKDELGELADSFNGMAKSLKDAQDNVQKKVEERTRQLEELNSHMVGRELKMIELKKQIKDKKKKA